MSLTFKFSQKKQCHSMEIAFFKICSRILYCAEIRWFRCQYPCSFCPQIMLGVGFVVPVEVLSHIKKWGPYMSTHIYC